MDIYIATTDRGTFLGAFTDKNDALRAVNGKGCDGWANGNITLVNDATGPLGTVVYARTPDATGFYANRWIEA